MTHPCNCHRELENYVEMLKKGIHLCREQSTSHSEACGGRGRSTYGKWEKLWPHSKVIAFVSILPVDFYNHFLIIIHTIQKFRVRIFFLKKLLFSKDALNWLQVTLKASIVLQKKINKNKSKSKRCITVSTKILGSTDAFNLDHTFLLLCTISAY